MVIERKHGQTKVRMNKKRNVVNVCHAWTSKCRHL